MQTSYLTSQPYQKRIFPLLTAQFLGVFNDNAFKMLAILAVVGPRSDYFLDASFMFAMTISYVLPFILLTAPAGSLCDRMQKRYIIILSKLFEFLVMILGAFCLGNSQKWGMYPLLGVMFLMTAQTISAFGVQQGDPSGMPGYFIPLHGATTAVTTILFFYLTVYMLLVSVFMYGSIENEEEVQHATLISEEAPTDNEQQPKTF